MFTHLKHLEKQKMKPKVYLAGPIDGTTEDEAKQWRSDVSTMLEAHNIKGISPLRCEPPIDGVYDAKESIQQNDKRFGTARAIGGKNFFDVQNCDMVLAYMPKISVGTVIEIGWARAFNMP